MAVPVHLLLHLALAVGSAGPTGNGTCVVELERDLLGRVVHEKVGDDTVSSEYGPLGLRTRMRTSRGHVLEIERNVVGDVLALRVGGGPAVAPGSDAAKDAPPAWEATLTRPPSEVHRGERKALKGYGGYASWYDRDCGGVPSVDPKL